MWWARLTANTDRQRQPRCVRSHYLTSIQHRHHIAAYLQSYAAHIHCVIASRLAHSLRDSLLLRTRRHSAYFFIPNLLKHFDHAEIVGSCIAPRPLLIVAPTEDSDMVRDGVEELKAHIVPIYGAANKVYLLRIAKLRC